MLTFWAKGYDGTTVDDLAAAMGIGRPSLYATFHDKETLFARSLEHYIHKIGSLTVQALQTPSDIHDAVRGFLRQAVENATAEGLPRGCMMSNVAPIVSDTNIQELSTALLTQPAKLVEQRLRDAVNCRQLPSDFPCALRARQIIDLSTGLTARARLGAAREELLSDAADAAALFFR